MQGIETILVIYAEGDEVNSLLLCFFFVRDLQTTFITYYTSTNDKEQGKFI